MGCGHLHCVLGVVFREDSITLRDSRISLFPSLPGSPSPSREIQAPHMPISLKSTWDARVAQGPGRGEPSKRRGCEFTRDILLQRQSRACTVTRKQWRNQEINKIYRQSRTAERVKKLNLCLLFMLDQNININCHIRGWIGKCRKNFYYKNWNKLKFTNCSYGSYGKQDFALETRMTFQIVK